MTEASIVDRQRFTSRQAYTSTPPYLLPIQVAPVTRLGWARSRYEIVSRRSSSLFPRCSAWLRRSFSTTRRESWQVPPEQATGERSVPRGPVPALPAWPLLGCSPALRIRPARIVAQEREYPQCWSVRSIATTFL